MLQLGSAYMLFVTMHVFAQQLIWVLIPKIKPSEDPNFLFTSMHVEHLDFGTRIILAEVGTRIQNLLQS